MRTKSSGGTMRSSVTGITKPFGRTTSVALFKLIHDGDKWISRTPSGQNRLGRDRPALLVPEAIGDRLSGAIGISKLQISLRQRVCKRIVDLVIANHRVFDDCWKG